MQGIQVTHLGWGKSEIIIANYWDEIKEYINNLVPKEEIKSVLVGEFTVAIWHIKPKTNP